MGWKVLLLPLYILSLIYYFFDITAFCCNFGANKTNNIGMKSKNNNSIKKSKTSAKTWSILIGIWILSGFAAYHILSALLIAPPFEKPQIKGDVIAEVGNIKIGKEELIGKTKELLQQIPDWDESENGATPPQFILTQMTNDALFDNFMNTLNIYVSENEVMDCILGNESKGIKQFDMIDEFMTYYNIESIETFIDMINNPSKYDIPVDLIAENSRLYNDLKSVILNYIKTQKVANVFARSLQANKIDTKLLYEEAIETKHISFVKKECAYISDNDINITDNEIIEFWEKAKKSFTLPNENRYISYINVLIAPSKEDLNNADIIVQKLKNYLSNNTDIDIINTPGVSIDTTKINIEETQDYQLQNFCSIAKPGDVKLLSIMDNVYSVTKYIGKDKNTATFINAKYKLTPTEKTIQNIKDNLSAYTKKFNTPKAFEDSANAYGYIIHKNHLTNTSPRIAFLYESRNALEWAMKANEGTVSDVFPIGKDGFIAVSIDGIYNDYIPAHNPSIKANILTHLKNEKKAQLLIDQYAGKADDLKGYSKLMSTPVEYAKISFDQKTIQGFGNVESKLFGTISVAEPGKMVGPVTCNNSIVYFVIDSIDDKRNEFVYDFNALSHVYFSKNGGAAIFSNIPDILIGNNEYYIKELLPTFEE